MLIIPCSWKRLEYGNFFLDREYKSPWLKQSKSQSKLKSESYIHFSLRSSGSLVSYVTRGRVLGFIAVGEGWCRPPRPYFFFNKDGNENVTRKFNLLSFKLYRVLLDPLNLSNISDF